MQIGRIKSLFVGEDGKVRTRGARVRVAAGSGSATSLQ